MLTMWKMEYHICDSLIIMIVADGITTCLADVIAMADGIAI